MKTTLLLDIAADAAGDRRAFGDLTFAELRHHAQLAASWIMEQAAGQVAFLGLNGSVVPTLLFASGYAGLPFCPLNYRLPDDKLNQLVARTAPSVLVADDDMVERIGDHDGVTAISRSAFEAEIGSRSLPEGWAEGDGEIAVLLFTSGTTGEPKAAVLRHENLTSYVMETVEFLGSDEDEAALVSVPAYHIAGISAILTGAYGGRRIVYIPAFKPEEWAETAAREKVTHAMVVPTMLDRILDSVEHEHEPLSSLRALSYGGGRMPEPVIARAMKLLPHVDFVNAYGLTETSSTIALLSAEDHRAAFTSEDHAVRRRLGSVGKPLPSLEIQIRGEDGKTVLPTGQSGEIYVRGPQVSGEYLGKKITDEEGWFATNDGGWLDEDGYLFVEGRLDDVIVRGGENISPGEIEDCLRGHAAIADVAVLGMPCTQWGEKVAAVVVSKLEVDCEELADHVRSSLRSTKTPEVWFFEDELPYNETGKLLRRLIKERLSDDEAAA
jgi:fatty-acyl-CoA synthase